jgi:xanthine dehydrogenase accessory factor
MIAEAWTYRQIAVIADPEWKIIGDIKPDVVIDAIMAKKNLGTTRNEAPLVIGVGPGFEAPHTVHAVIESNRGPDLGRAIYSGAPAPFTGVPALKAGYSCERTLRAPSAGNVRRVKSIGDSVKAGEAILFVNDAPITAEIDGIVRGMIAEIHVAEGEKLGDIEPGSDPSCCWKISDKARAIGGGVLEAVMHFLNK